MALVEVFPSQLFADLPMQSSIGFVHTIGYKLRLPTKSRSINRSFFFVGDTDIKLISWSIVIGSSPNFDIRVNSKRLQSQINCKAVSCTSSSQKLL